MNEKMNVFTKTTCIYFALILVCNILSVKSNPAPDLHFLEPGDTIKNNKQGLKIFCHNAKSKYLIHLWKTVIMDLRTNLDTYEIYDGKTPKEVIEKHEINQRSWKFNLFGTKRSKEFKINPFEDTCIGIYTYPYNQFEYVLSMTQLRIDLWKILMTIVGIALFLLAPKLSQNPLFYYICGITLGVTMSLVILIYFVAKLLPKGKFMYAMAAAGWTFSFYLIQALWENAQIIMLQYKDWVFWYIVITSLISFIICYRFGPVTNVRTKKIIQWFLQATGLILIYYSSYFREASFLCSTSLVLLYNFPVVVIQKGRRYWKLMFPEKRRLLTDDEFRKEGERETRKALQDLQGYCSSPDCNPWKTVLKLKNPVRFARFMEGESHLSEDEVTEHDAEISKLIEECEYTEDEDDY